MRLTVKIKPNAKTESVERLSDGTFSVRVKAPAKEGRANEALIKALSDHFDLPKSRISIINGLGSKNKVVEII